MPIIAAVGFFFQVFFAVHAVRTGRDRYWIYILIFFPGVGSLIYFFTEYLPDLQHGRRLQRFRTGVGQTLNPGRYLRALQEQVEVTPSVKNKKLLAETYVNLGRFDEAIDLYQSCQEGAHQDDLSILEGLGCAHFFKGDYPTAEGYLEQAIRHGETVNPDPFKLLLARCREALGKDEAAEALYREVVRTFSGEEARGRYALFLKARGRTAEADRLFEETLKNARLSPKYYRKAQKPWIETARRQRSGRPA